MGLFCFDWSIMNESFLSLNSHFLSSYHSLYSGPTCILLIISISEPGFHLYHQIPIQYMDLWVPKISIPTINSTFYNYQGKQEKRVNHEWIKNLLVDFCHSHARMRAVSLLKSFFFSFPLALTSNRCIYTKMQENTFSCIKTRKAYESPKKVFNVMRTSCCLTALLLRVHYRTACIFL